MHGDDLYMKFDKKKFSILGDSISTFEGYNPDGYLVYYQGQIGADLGVKRVDDTWWMQVIRYYHGSLVANNSYTGSRACGLKFPAANRDERIHALHTQEWPDVIIIYLGANDYGGGEVLFGAGECCFEGAYEQIIQKIKCLYPLVEIICVAGGQGTRKTREPSMLEGGDQMRNYHLLNDIIRTLALKYDCLLVDIEKNCGLYDSIDGVHPTGRGMTQIADTFVKGMDSFVKVVKNA